MAFTNKVANKLKSLSGVATSIIGGGFGGGFLNSKPTPDLTAQAENLLNKSPAEIDTSSIAHMKENPFQFGTVSYPSSVEDGNLEGHYMIFHILTSTPGASQFDSTVRVDNKITKTKTLASGLPFERQDTYDVADLSLSQKEKDRNDFILAHNNKVSKLRQGGFTRSGYQRTKDIISLYMPGTINVNYKTNYKQESLSTLEKLVAGAAEGGVSGLFGAGFDAGKDAIAKIQSKARSLSTGNITVDRQEMLFEGIDYRTFSFEYNFIPKNEKEALSVDKICTLFKYHSRPKIQGATTGAYKFRLPSQFQIQYMYRDKENQFLNRIGTVVCTNVDITYGEGEQWKTFRPSTEKHGAQPVKTNLKLEFTEIDLVDKTAIADGNF